MECTVCAHPQRRAIDRALLAGDHTYVHLRELYGSSISALYRHKKHLLERLRQAGARLETRRHLHCLQQLNFFLEAAAATAKTAQAEGDSRLLLQAVREGVRLVNALSRFQVSLPPDLVHRLLTSPHWAETDSPLPLDDSCLAHANQSLAAGLDSPCPADHSDLDDDEDDDDDDADDEDDEDDNTDDDLEDDDEDFFLDDDWEVDGAAAASTDPEGDWEDPATCDPGWEDDGPDPDDASAGHAAADPDWPPASGPDPANASPAWQPLPPVANPTLKTRNPKRQTPAPATRRPASAKLARKNCPSRQFPLQYHCFSQFSKIFRQPPGRARYPKFAGHDLGSPLFRHRRPPKPRPGG